MSSNIEDHYLKCLEDIKNLEIKIDESEETELDKIKNELDNLKKTLCGFQTIESNDFKPANTQKLFDDLNNQEIDVNKKECMIKLVAELAKNENCREFLVNQNIFIPINNCLKETNINDLTRIQIYRAIGNLCYYNDSGRLTYLNSCGLQDLIQICKYCTTIDLSETSENQLKEKITLISVSLGCLHNLTNENETLRRAVYELNIMSILKGYIKYLKKSKAILIHFGSCIENLFELDELKKQFTEEKLALDLYEILDEEIYLNLDDHTEDFFNVLSLIYEQDKSQQFMLQTEFLVKFIDFIEKNLDKSDLLRNCCLYLVGLIVRVENLDEIYEYKNSLLLQKAIDWLEPNDNQQLHVASAVIIAHYLRGDQFVMKMIKDSRQPHAKLIDLARFYNNQQISVTTTQRTPLMLNRLNVVHSILGAIRNFCVALPAREDILKQNIVELVFSILKNESLDNLEIKFKALSILRLLIKSSNDKLGLPIIFDDENLKLIESIVLNIDHAGVVGESSRLLCYMPVSAKTDERIAKFCQYKFVEKICKQLKSEYLIMLNEALIALNVLVTINYNACESQLKVSTELNSNLTYVLEKESLPVEMRMNTFRLFKILYEKTFFNHHQLKSHFKSLKKLLLNLSDSNDSSSTIVKGQINSLIKLIENDVIDE